MRDLEVGLRCLIGVVFLTSFATKITGRGAFDSFVASVRRMPVLSGPAVRPVARAAVAGEAAVCVLLAVPYPATGVVGFTLAAGLLAAFAAGIVHAVRRGTRTPCRCFGPSTTPLGPRHAVRNVILSSVALAGAVAALEPGRVTAAGALVAGVAGLVLGGLVTVLDDIVDLFRPIRKAPGAPR